MATNQTSSTPSTQTPHTTSSPSTQTRPKPTYKDVFQATKRDDLLGVKHFIEEKKEPVTIVDFENKTIALVAAEQGHFQIMKYILEKNSALVNHPDRSGNTVLERVIEKGDLEVVKYLVEKHKVDIVAINHHINTAVHVAALEGQLPILKYFIEEKKADVNLKNLNGEPPIFSAAEKPHMHVIMYLVEECHADPTITDVTKDNILFKSARYDDINVPKYLLDTKKLNLDVNWRNTAGYTAVNWACRFNHTQFVEYIVVNKKADVNIGDTMKGRTPLHHAAVKNNAPLCKFLVEHGANIELKDKFGSTALELTSDPEVSKILYGKTSAKSNRRRRNAVDSIISSGSEGKHNILMREMIAGNVQNQPLYLLGAGRQESAVRNVTSVLDGFLTVVDMVVRYAKGLSYQQISHQQFVLTPQEHIQSRMDGDAVYAVNHMPDFEEDRS